MEYDIEVVRNERTVGRRETMYICSLEKRCMELWGKLVRRSGRCELCGDTSEIQAHHPFGRKGHWSIKFNPDLGVCLCMKCHIRLDKTLSDLLAELLPILLIKQPGRAALLQKTAREYKRFKSGRADFQAIRADLERFEREHSDGWMDPEPEYGRTV